MQFMSDSNGSLETPLIIFLNENYVVEVRSQKKLIRNVNKKFGKFL